MNRMKHSGVICSKVYAWLELLIACIVCVVCVSVTVAIPTAIAQDSPGDQSSASKVVRVGWYDSAFHSTDQFGRRSGYGYEYQQRVAIYTGWDYEYVEGSWSELFEKLENGEIDLLSDVSYTPERAEKVLYSSEAMGSEGYHVFIAPTNTEIRPDDFSTRIATEMCGSCGRFSQTWVYQCIRGLEDHP